MKKFLAPVLLGLSLAAGAQADGATDAVLARLKQLYPQTEFSSVRPSPLPGLYQVVAGRNVAFTDEQGRYFLFGDLWDMPSSRNLTAETRKELARLDWRKLPLERAIKVVSGSGKRVFAVFSDPDCPYCHKLESELSGMTDYTMYVFLMPLESLHPDARAKAQAIWCSKDAAKAWLDWMRGGKRAAKADCASPIDQNLQLASDFGIQGTPFLVNQQGDVKPGAAPRDALEAFLGTR